MPIFCRPAILADLEPALSIQPAKLGDAFVGKSAAREIWRRLVSHPAFFSGVYEADPPIRGTKLICFGSAVFLAPGVADAELDFLKPDINSRFFESLLAGRPALANRAEIARGNACGGLDILVLSGGWRDEILQQEERQALKAAIPKGFADAVAGYRVRRIIHETACEPTRRFAAESLVYRPVAEFPELGRTIFLMTPESVAPLPAHVGQIIFDYRQPKLHLRDSDQELLSAALKGMIDEELAIELGLSPAAVKARWRSTFARIAYQLPSLAGELNGSEGRGKQKRHKILEYFREHKEELRPYDWDARSHQSKPQRAPLTFLEASKSGSSPLCQPQTQRQTELRAQSGQS